ncbi:MAG TPA: hypothetical protein VLE99_02665 [Candidatus Saccharimonadales bacterium]|nr:hypothetical protein [Candidatus Saccharimonadales bacterium]
MNNSDVPVFDPKDFSVEPYVRRIEKPWGYELHLVPNDSEYMAKIMHIQAGCRQSLQIHERKVETYIMHSGRALVEMENNQGEMVQVEIPTDQAITTQVGQKHRIVAITDCDVFEASTRERGTTWRLEDDYARSDDEFGTEGRTATFKNV